MPKVKLYYKRIQLPPTRWFVDVFVCKDTEQICQEMQRMYKGDIEEYRERVEPPSVHGIYVKEVDRVWIICTLRNFNVIDIIHEAVHITWYLADRTGLKYDVEHQEFQAYCVEYIFEEIMEMKSL